MMKVEIDLAADAAAIQWAPRATGSSRVVGSPGRPAVRLYFNDAGDVVGLEVLGWSHRTSEPTVVDVRLYPKESAEVLGPESPLAQALRPVAIETDEEHRPVHGGERLMTVAEAAAKTGLDRSWLSRQMARGHLKGQRIGRTWWTSDEWLDNYLQRGRERNRERAKQRLMQAMTKAAPKRRRQPQT